MRDALAIRLQFNGDLHNNMPNITKAFFQTAGFTLSELLISLSVLGLISALTLPTVFNSVNTRKEKAIFRETISSLQEVVKDAAANGAQPQGIYTMVEKNMNVVRCNSNLGVLAPDEAQYQSGCILQNGAWIIRLEPWVEDFAEVVIDWNGNEAPNTMNKDRIRMAMTWGIEPKTGYWSDTVLNRVGVNELRQGEVRPWKWSKDRYNEIFE
jgi:prepilin-type N-terminal cleavage/methylation domain-containing protein